MPRRYQPLELLEPVEDDGRGRLPGPGVAPQEHEGLAITGRIEGLQPVLSEREPHDGPVEVALEQLGRSASECLMVGDRVETDMLMGHRAGMATALVLTGVTQRADLAHAPVQPDYVLESIAQVPRLFDPE